MVNNKTYQASAPGSIMLFGEHAVLRNKLALVSAVNKKIHVKLIPRSDNQIIINSNLGKYETRLDKFEHNNLFKFVLTSIEHHISLIPTGFELVITSEFSHTVGLGSSSAVVVAVLHCLMQWLLNSIDTRTLFHDARNIIRNIQGSGSGADIAASVYGGVLAYRPDNPLEIKKINFLPEVSLIYAGYKTSTPVVIQKVNELIKSNPEKYTKLFNQMESCVSKAKSAFEQKDLITIGLLMQEHQEYQKLLNTSDSKLETLISESLEQDNIFGAKISGSGLGDCIIALGKINKNISGEIIPIKLSSDGVCCESK